MRSMEKAIQQYMDLEKKDKAFITYGDIEQLYHRFMGIATDGSGIDITKIITESMMAGIALGYRAGYRNGKKKEYKNAAKR